MIPREGKITSGFFISLPCCDAIQWRQAICRKTLEGMALSRKLDIFHGSVVYWLGKSGIGAWSSREVPVDSFSGTG